MAKGLGCVPSGEGSMEVRLNMKKVTLIIAAILLTLGLTACGNNEGQATNDATQAIQTESSQETENANNTEEMVDQTKGDDAVTTTSEEVTEDTAKEAPTSSGGGECHYNW